MHHFFKKSNMKRILSVFMAAVWVLMLCIPCAAYDTSGTCGDGVNWSFADGVLTISGSGAMKNFSETRPAPWQAITDEIRIVTVESGVTSIGNLAFYLCDTIVTVNLPDTLTSIGKYAFAGCTKLKTLNMGSRVVEIGNSAFERCESLQAIRLPNTLTAIGTRAFYRCESLKMITVPQSVTSIGEMAFTYCSSLITADVRAQVSELPMWTFYGCEMLTDLTLGASIVSLGDSALWRCDLLKSVHYLGSESNGAALLEDIKKSVPNFRDSALIYDQNQKTETTQTEEIREEDVLTTNTITVQNSENSMISTTVTKTNKVTEDGKKEEKLSSSVSIEAVVENKDGWFELTEKIVDVEHSVDVGTDINVSVSVNGSTEVSGEVFSELAGKNVEIRIENSDGTDVKINCEKMQPEVADQTYTFTYRLTRNSNPTEQQRAVFGDAANYYLEFIGDTTLKYSPRIYLGAINAHKCAVLYQQFAGAKMERVQSAIIDKDGYATFYLGKTLSSVTYMVAIDVKGEKYSDAIVPDEYAVDSGEIEIYEPIEYVITGERIFMGMNFNQFSFVIFGVIFALAAIIGTVMAIFYRKKRLEMFYKLKMGEGGEDN